MQSGHSAWAGGHLAPDLCSWKLGGHIQQFQCLWFWNLLRFYAFSTLPPPTFLPQYRGMRPTSHIATLSTWQMKSSSVTSTSESTLCAPIPWTWKSAWRPRCSQWSGAAREGPQCPWPTPPHKPLATRTSASLSAATNKELIGGGQLGGSVGLQKESMRSPARKSGAHFQILALSHKWLWEIDSPILGIRLLVREMDLAVMYCLS